MKKETILIIVITLAVGLLGGVIVSNSKKDSAPDEYSPASASAIDYAQKIQTLKGITSKEPDNRNAWVQLGHSYFDSNQPMEAIEAYDKALELDDNDPDVLTDQGVMYRKVGWFDKAINNFTKANELKPTHLQSLFNLGIVYRYDLNDTGKAKSAWTRYLKIVPQGQGANQVKTMLDHMEKGHE